MVNYKVKIPTKQTPPPKPPQPEMPKMPPPPPPLVLPPSAFSDSEDDMSFIRRKPKEPEPIIETHKPEPLIIQPPPKPKLPDNYKAIVMPYQDTEGDKERRAMKLFLAGIIITAIVVMIGMVIIQRGGI